ncbi:MAG: type II toxin-antitoxin system HicB family antitoxin [Saprospiraceae bacterium]|nr:type II toxin-antitoxin system HicB family antitoxin [Saprospiraceae bacterium]
MKEYPGVFTGGETLTELMTNANEAIRLYFEGSEEPSIVDPKFELVVDLQEFFSHNDYIDITKLAKRTGMNTSLLRQYAKGIKFPSIEQVARIEKTLKEIGAELINTHLLNKPLETS